LDLLIWAAPIESSNCFFCAPTAQRLARPLQRHIAPKEANSAPPYAHISAGLQIETAHYSPKQVAVNRALHIPTQHPCSAQPNPPSHPPYYVCRRPSEATPSVARPASRPAYRPRLRHDLDADFTRSSACVCCLEGLPGFQACLLPAGALSAAAGTCSTPALYSTQIPAAWSKLKNEPYRSTE
jgi:hypothetical protein